MVLSESFECHYWSLLTYDDLLLQVLLPLGGAEVGQKVHSDMHPLYLLVRPHRLTMITIIPTILSTCLFPIRDPMCCRLRNVFTPEWIELIPFLRIKPTTEPFDALFATSSKLRSSINRPSGNQLRTDAKRDAPVR